MHKDVSIEITKSSIEAQGSYLLAFYEGALELVGAAKKIDESSGNALSYAFKNGFLGEKGETKIISPAGELHAAVLIGLGKKEGIRTDHFMDSFSDAVKAARNEGIKELNVVIDSFSMKRAAYLIALSASVGSHRLVKFRTKGLDKIKNVEKIVLMSENPQSHAKEIEDAKIVSDAIKRTRDMVNTPPNILNTEEIASYAAKIAKENKLSLTILDEAKLEQLKMGCILAVGKGSASRPKIIILEYRGGEKSAPLALVGKGITFDSGGYNLKPTNAIGNMKDDKAGAITVMHVIEAASKMKLPINLVAVLVLAENMVSGGAFRPDDILTAHNGLTVEVTNTDAEGRLVLADALSYTEKTYKPAAMVDIATLTGASMIALGHFTTPIVGSDDALVKKVMEAAEKSGERMWQLPLWEEYKESIKSDIADMKNATDGPDAGVIIGGMFLKQFVDETKWAHLDIGTTVWSKAEKGIKQKGATGVCVRTLIEFVKDWK